MSLAAAPAASPRIETDLVKLYLGFSGMVIGQFMAILDIQIVAASISEVQAGIGATADEIAWIQSAYLLAEVVAMPLSAYISRLWGTRTMFMVCVSAFMVTSIMAGLATSIDFMIMARALQGFSAGAMIPAVFAIAFTVFPVERRTSAAVIVGMIVTLAPTIGPTLGGHLTEALSWRWLFFINIPPGLLVLYLVGRWGDFDRGDPSLARGVDWPGLIAMAVSLLAIQWVLEEGAENNWFAEDYIIWLTVLGLTAGAFFVWRQLTYRQPIVNLKPFADRNFTIGMLVALVAGMSLFGGTFIIPLYLGQIRDYSAAAIGTVMLVAGLAMFVSAPLCRALLRHVSIRLTIFAGFMIAAYSSYLGVRITDEWGFGQFALLQILRSVGVMMGMIAAQVMTVSTLHESQMKDASAIMNLTRNVGGAIGLAMISTTLTVGARRHLVDLSSSVSQTNLEAQAFLARLTERMISRGVADPEGAAAAALSGMINRQAAVLAFGEAFMWMAAAALAAGVFALFANPPRTVLATVPQGAA
jgi:DHA2 family multidrug resistance protein